MIQLNIHGLYFGTDLKNRIHYKDGAGVYIWGFTGGKGKFIPLYVGKHKASVWSRVEEHFLNLHYGNKYRIFSKEFYNALLKGNLKLPKVAKISKKDNLAQELKDCHPKLKSIDCIFSCDPSFLVKKYPELKAHLGGYMAKSITSQGLEKKGNPLNIQNVIDRYFSLQRFAFLILLPASNTMLPNKKTLNTLEANVKFALKNGTLSDSKNFKREIQVSIYLEEDVRMKPLMKDLFHGENEKGSESVFRLNPE